MDKNQTPTHNKIYEALEDLQDGVKITQQRVADYAGLSIRTVKSYWIESFKDLVKDYNDSLKTKKYVEEANDDEFETEDYNSWHHFNELTKDIVAQKRIELEKELFESTIIDIQKRIRLPISDTS